MASVASGGRRAGALACRAPEPRLLLGEFVAMSRSAALQAKTDAELVRLCRDGDAMAWRAIVQRFRRVVLGVPHLLGLHGDDADDVFQLTFVQLHRALPGLREPDRVEAWLVTTAKRGALRLLRERTRRARLGAEWADLALDDVATPAEEEIERMREGERVIRALESLDESCRVLLVALFSDSSESYRRIAARMGLAVGTLGAKRARCLRRLRARLLRRGALRDGDGT